MPELTQVFDRNDMPEDIQKYFSDQWEDLGNNSFVELTRGDMNETPEDPVILWLKANGQDDKYPCLIKFWW